MTTADLFASSLQDQHAARVVAGLEHAALSGADWPELTRELAVATCARLWLLGPDGYVVARADASTMVSSGVRALRDGGPLLLFAEAETRRVTQHLEPVDACMRDGTLTRVVPVVAGRFRVGSLVFALVPPPDTATAVERAASAFAIAASRREAIASAAAESAEWLIDELRFGTGRDAVELAHVADRFGWRVDRPHRAAVLALDGLNQKQWRSAAMWLTGPVRFVDGAAWTVVSGRAAAELPRMRARLERAVGERVLLAVGSVAASPAESARSFSDAEVVFALLRADPARCELQYDELGLAALLMGLPAPALREYVERMLEALLPHEDLLGTLDEWFRSGGSWATTADRLHIHRNSVGYRLQRIRDLLGRDPIDADVARDLGTALVARRVLVALEQLGRV